MDNYLQDLFIDEAKAALDSRGGGGSGGGKLYMHQVRLYIRLPNADEFSVDCTIRMYSSSSTPIVDLDAIKAYFGSNVPFCDGTVVLNYNWCIPHHIVFPAMTKTLYCYIYCNDFSLANDAYEFGIGAYPVDMTPMLNLEIDLTDTKYTVNITDLVKEV